ncbi:MAG: glutamine amidotransferase [Gammaproteobacteria bacterium]|jgi:GMP synthase (glutamine-hydrolysing)|nr:glutamine amidotransferase [Gammaproteobacteria bacterium]
MKPVLIIKTGHTVQTAYAKIGDFERWIIASMRADKNNFQVVEVYKDQKLPALNEVSGVVITGSSAMVTDKLDWSEYTAEWLRQAISVQLPIVGICYGHQLLAHALGGLVAYNSLGREIGTTVVSPLPGNSEDALFAEIKEPFTVHVSHMQSVVELPPNTKILASNNFDPHHAVMFSELCWGLQFHPEFDEVAMQSYIEERQDDLKQEGLDVKALLDGVKPTPIARNILEDFYKLIRRQ